MEVDNAGSSAKTGKGKETKDGKKRFEVKKV